MTSSALDYDLAAPGVHHVVEHADVRLLRDLLEQVRDRGRPRPGGEAHRRRAHRPAAAARADQRNSGVETTTPTGHTYRSQAPPGLPPPL